MGRWSRARSLLCRGRRRRPRARSPRPTAGDRGFRSGREPSRDLGSASISSTPRRSPSVVPAACSFPTGERTGFWSRSRRGAPARARQRGHGLRFDGPFDNPAAAAFGPEGRSTSPMEREALRSTDSTKGALAADVGTARLSRGRAPRSGGVGGGCNGRVYSWWITGPIGSRSSLRTASTGLVDGFLAADGGLGGQGRFGLRDRPDDAPERFRARRDAAWTLPSDARAPALGVGRFHRRPVSRRRERSTRCSSSCVMAEARRHDVAPHRRASGTALFSRLGLGEATRGDRAPRGEQGGRRFSRSRVRLSAP